jgi:hypothetical protein
MRVFNKQSNERISNGVYKIDGTKYLSVWAFKRQVGLSGSTSTNAAEGRQISSTGCGTHSSTPDFGGFSEIALYPEHALRAFYNN